MNDEVRFGIMCRGYKFSKWQAKCIEKLLELPDVKLCLLVIDENHNATKTLMVKRPLLKKFLSKIYTLLFRKYLFRIYNKNLKIDALQIVDLEHLLKFTPKIGCFTTKKGKYSEYKKKKDIERVSEYGLDFMLRFTFNILRGEILEVPRYGVWSFHHDDEQIIRGGPPCFWEIYHEHDATGAILQKLNDELDAGIVLRKGYFNTIKTSYAANFNNALMESTEWPKQVCKDILNGAVDYFEDAPSVSSAPMYYAPNNAQMIKFFAISIKNRLKQKKDTIFRKREIWNIGIANKPIASFMEENKPEIIWLKKPAKNRFIADPFGFKAGNILHLLYEDYDYRINRGVISEIQLDDWSKDIKAHDDPRPIITMDTHMSYPYTIDYEGDIYCVPETGDVKEVSLFKFNSATGNWSKIKTLLSGKGFIDSTIFYYEDLWWLFCTIKEQNPVQNLFIWYSKTLFGPWIEHKNNPVKMDIRSARPAGTPFMYDGSMCRPAQDCSIDYGHNLALNKILELSPIKFKEETIAFMGPFNNSPYSCGFHTISGIGNITLVDGRKDKIFIDRNGFAIYRLAKKLYKAIFRK